MAFIRNNDFTKSQLKGLDIVYKLISTKYKFIVGYKLTDRYQEYIHTLFLDFYIDVDKFTETYGYVPFGGKCQKEISLANFVSFRDSGIIDKDYKKVMGFFFDLEEKIKISMNSYYKSLPENFQIFISNDEYSRTYIVELGISLFIEKC